MVRASTTSDPAMTAQVQVSDRPALDHVLVIRLWLCIVAALVLAMVLVGGATRLTESGLSITEWRPVMGVVPPFVRIGRDYRERADPGRRRDSHGSHGTLPIWSTPRKPACSAIRLD